MHKCCEECTQNSGVASGPLLVSKLGTLAPIGASLPQIFVNMEKIIKVVDWLRGQSLVTQILSVLVVIILAVIALFFASCSQLTPLVSDNKVGAEGVVKKEKSVSRQTKWYFKDPTVDVQETDSFE